MPKPVLLWTDVLIYCLLVSSVLALFSALKKEHLRLPLRQVTGCPTAMAALVVLFFYLLVGLSDSFHFRLKLDERPGQQIQYAPEVLSLLDIFVGPLRTRVETTYSAPLAIEAYTKETVEDKTGRRSRVYPRLLYGGSHLKDPNLRLSDIYGKAVKGSAFGLVVVTFLATIGVFLLSRVHKTVWRITAGRVLRGQCHAAWRTTFITAGVLIIIFFALAPLATHYHLLGTDKVGQDVLYLSLKAVRTGLVIATLTTLIMLPFAVLLGISAGYFKGRIDDLIQYLYTTLSAVPGVLLIAAAVLMLQIYMDIHADDFSSIAQRADIRLFFLCVILGSTGWIGLCRLLRGETLKITELEYVQAARALGVSQWKIITRHVLPNVTHIILISAVLDCSGLVLSEAVLSYVGVGVDPSMISWGNMINSARLEMAHEPIIWWSLLAAFMMMFGLVLSANIFADGVRDALDPHLQRG